MCVDCIRVHDPLRISRTLVTARGPIKNATKPINNPTATPIHPVNTRPSNDDPTPSIITTAQWERVLFVILADVLPVHQALEVKSYVEMNVTSFPNVAATGAGPGMVERKHIATA